MIVLFPAALFGAFLALLIMPFVPAVLELKFPKDKDPLSVNGSCSGQPRYFARSFRPLLRAAMSEEPGTQKTLLSKEETVEAAASKNLRDGQALRHILYAAGDIRTGKGARLEKEVYVLGSAFIGERNVLRAITAEGDLYISRLTRVTRWADSDAGMHVSEGCDLGASAGSGGALILAGDSVFKRLFGNPVTVCPGEDFPGPVKNKNSGGPGAPGKSDKEKKCMVIGPALLPGAQKQNVIAKKDLLVKKGCVVSGGIKAYGDVALDEGVTVRGNLFAEGDIDIGPGSVVLGNVFSQGFVRLGPRARVGRPGGVKSAIGKKGMILERGSAVHGYAMTEGKGAVKEKCL